MYNSFFKRPIDFTISFVGIILLIPVFIVVSILLLISLKGNPFFFQYRPGKGEKIFKIIKFRTMLNTKDKYGDLLPDHLRLFGFGKFVRKLSLDEIPQLINVLMGDMSLIGPRPLLVEYLPLYNNIQKRRHTVRPGITGWAQVNGRNAISWEQKFKFDVWYVDNISFFLDLKIIFLTIKKVFISEGINANESTTMPFFKGNKNI